MAKVSTFSLSLELSHFLFVRLDITLGWQRKVDRGRLYCILLKRVLKSRLLTSSYTDRVCSIKHPKLISTTSNKTQRYQATMTESVTIEKFSQTQKPIYMPNILAKK